MKKRRVFKKTTKRKILIETGQTKVVRNPYFSKEVMTAYQLKGWIYNTPAYIEEPVYTYEYETDEEEQNQLEFEITCSHCNTKVWRKKSFTKFCSDSCRVMSWRAKKQKGE